MEDSDEEEPEEDARDEFNIIPPYSEKDSNTESGARGSQRGAANRVVPVLPLLLLPSLILSWSPNLILGLHCPPAAAVKRIPEWTTGDSSKEDAYEIDLFSLIIL